MIRPESKDTIVVLGDVVDRGPDSRGAMAQLLELQKRCRLVCILGNHEQMLLDAFDGEMPVQQWLQHGGADTLDSYGRGAGVNAIDGYHIQFMRTWGDVFETPGEFFCHGNYAANKPLGEQLWRVRRWQSLKWHTPGPHHTGKTAIVGHSSNKQGKIVNLGHLICIDTYCCGGQWLTALEPGTGRVWQARDSGEVREAALPPVQRIA